MKASSTRNTLPRWEWLTHPKGGAVSVLRFYDLVAFDVFSSHYLNASVSSKKKELYLAHFYAEHEGNVVQESVRASEHEGEEVLVFKCPQEVEIHFHGGLANKALVEEKLQSLFKAAANQQVIPFAANKCVVDFVLSPALRPQDNIAVAHLISAFGTKASSKGSCSKSSSSNDLITESKTESSENLNFESKLKNPQSPLFHQLLQTRLWESCLYKARGPKALAYLLAIKEQLPLLPRSKQEDAKLSSPNFITGSKKEVSEHLKLGISIVQPFLDSLDSVKNSSCDIHGFDYIAPVKVVLLGPANAGKSSLFNALAGSCQALVSDIAGTTRDVLSTSFILGGFEILLVDTAGFFEDNQQEDAIQLSSKELGIKSAHEADIWLELGPLPKELQAVARGKEVLKLCPKLDLGAIAAKDEWAFSSLTGAGLKEILDELSERVQKLRSGKVSAFFHPSLMSLS